ncbi:MAG: YlmH/Sll1252 family protein [Christensenellales bacterium]|jgi:RNA-binding protein YlmH
MQKDAVFSSGRMDDLISRAQRTGITQFTPFIDPAAAWEMARICKSIGLPCHSCGGYDEAERRVLAVGDGAKEAVFPVQALMVSWDKRFEGPAHHDILGAIMALGVKRETFGDILAGDGAAYVFALSTMAQTILLLSSAGRATVRVDYCEPKDIIKPRGRTVSATFKSFRLDAIVAEAMRISRPGASQLISQGRVFLNFVPCLKADERIKTGDIISVRGMGRVKIGEAGGRSRKDRIYLTMEVFSRT